MAEAVGGTDSENKKTCRPFLKWAGGKTQLLPELLARIPGNYNRFYEPFLGGGAMFFALQPAQAVLSDLNPELINVFTVVRDQVEELIIDLTQHIYDEGYFYAQRELDRQEDFKKLSPVKRASRFIYLNRTCYNGLYRVNSKGQFNVPFGRYTNPTIVDSIALRACSQALHKASLQITSFESVLNAARAGDFIYFDPPYFPISEKSNFTAYHQEGFARPLQEYLRNICVQLDFKGIKFMLSNSSHPLMREIYSNFNVEEVSASRAINSKGGQRGDVTELIIRNYK